MVFLRVSRKHQRKNNCYIRTFCVFVDFLVPCLLLLLHRVSQCEPTGDRNDSSQCCGINILAFPETPGQTAKRIPFLMAKPTTPAPKNETTLEMISIPARVNDDQGTFAPIPALVSTSS